jgi:hypothetical protein
MRFTSRILLALLALLLGPLLLISCKQGEGDRCQIDGDCSGGLECCYDPPNPDRDTIIREGGTCQPPDKCIFSSHPEAGLHEDGPARDTLVHAD